MSFPIGRLEHRQTRLTFALLLRDRLSFADALVGNVGVTAGPRTGLRKNASGTFLFFELPNGAVDLAVRSGADTPYYLPADITVTLPPASPLWPALPNISLANSSLPLWDPGQPAAYRTQFLQSCLSPTTAYPFDSAATLVRGTVLHAGAPVPTVTVSDLGGLALPYVTATDGQFVLVFQKAPGPPTNVTIRARRSGNPDVDVNVTVRRAVTVSVVINV
jgi:hypothetical protein